MRQRRDKWRRLADNIRAEADPWQSGCGVPAGPRGRLAAISQTTTHMHGHHEATMGLAGVPGPRAQSSSSEPHRTAHRCSVAPPEISVTKSRTDCALTQQMVGGIKAVSPWLKSASEKLLMGSSWACPPCWRRVARSARWGQPHRGTHACHGYTGVAVPLSYNWQLLVCGDFLSGAEFSF